jgi:hypothetical protein
MKIEKGFWIDNEMMKDSYCCGCHDEDDMCMNDWCGYSNCGECDKIECEYHCECECHKRCNENHK